MPCSALAESNKSAGTVEGDFASLSVFDLAVLGVESASFGTSFVTATLSTAPFVRFIFPSACQRGSGSPDFVFKASVSVPFSAMSCHSSPGGAHTLTVTSPARPG